MVLLCSFMSVVVVLACWFGYDYLFGLFVGVRLWLLCCCALFMLASLMLGLCVGVRLL